MESKKYVDFDKVITTYKTFGHLNLHNALEAFNEIPAADVRLVVHGAWQKPKFPYSWYKCTCDQCSYEAQDSGWTVELGEEAWFDYQFKKFVEAHNFCPNCGADMREIINE